MCDWDDQEILESNLAVLEKLEEEFTTPIHICAFKSQNKTDEILLNKGLLLDKNKKLLFFDPANKDSAKDILLNILS
jgi:hypothetical protein